MRSPSAAVLLILGLVLGGCAAPSAVLRQPPAQNISLADARADAESHQGVAVRWGGMLLSTASEPAATWLEILEYPLDEDGRPQVTQTAGGRFLARTGEALNTAAYPPGSQITVAGPLAGTVQGAV
ncbi:MAG: Slp family lipoprotein, partial [Pseudomonadota bacterium]|nr:Slp family lipoprotein [Pseudomonadota bacterium]